MLHAVKQCLRRLHICDNRSARDIAQYVFGEDLKQLVAPDNTSLAVNRTNAVAIAVKSHSEIEMLFRDKLLQIDQIYRVGGIGVMIGKLAIHIHKQKMVLTG